MRRRTLVASVLAGSLSLPGCMAAPELLGPDLPEECPKSQELGVEWSRDLDESTVAAFIEAYEEEYYRQVVFEYEPDSRFSSVGSAISRVKNVTEVDGGWRVHFSGVLGVNEAFMHLDATRSDRPEGAEILASSDIDDERIRELLRDAAETGEAEVEIGSEETDEYVDRFEALAEDFAISEADPRDALYIDVDGTTVELVVSVDAYHADRFWDAWYYVDEHVVWRSGDHDVDPRDAELLECRTTD